MSRSAEMARSVIEPTPLSRRVAAALVVAYAIIATIPLVWIFMTGFKTPSDAIAYPPKVIFEPSLEGYVNLFTERTRQTPDYMASLPPPETWYEELVRSRNMVITGPSRFAGIGSTFTWGILSPAALRWSIKRVSNRMRSWGRTASGGRFAGNIWRRDASTLWRVGRPGFAGF